jgi:glyoxylase-like metal-dependent hydrolase (beta-lactamase superfamily II)
MAEQALDRQRPINSPLKSKKIRWREPENPIRWAYAKLLREQSSIKTLYDINPYAEVYRFRDGIYGIYTESLDGMGDPWMYLVVGPERAMLIDTGFGVGDLKGLVRQIIGEMPLVVVNTHAHFDHAYGNCQFDTVFCHEYEADNLQAVMRPDIWDYLFDENGDGFWAEFDRDDIVPFKPYDIVGVPDGHLFDLGGGHEIELVFLAGHTCGHAGFLDKQNRIFFCGDDACYGSVGIGASRPDNPHAGYASVEGLYNELVKLTARMDEFDGLYPGHGPVDAGTIMLVNVMEACKAVLDDPEAYDDSVERSWHGATFTQYRKMIYMSGYLCYTSEKLYLDGSPTPR